MNEIFFDTVLGPCVIGILSIVGFWMVYDIPLQQSVVIIADGTAHKVRRCRGTVYSPAVEVASSWGRGQQRVPSELIVHHRFPCMGHHNQPHEVGWKFS